MVRMLGSYGRQNQTEKALWELDNLCRTLYILNFIDDVGLPCNTRDSRMTWWS
jgi:TnpA family transposase